MNVVRSVDFHAVSTVQGRTYAAESAVDSGIFGVVSNVGMDSVCEIQGARSLGQGHRLGLGGIDYYILIVKRVVYARHHCLRIFRKFLEDGCKPLEPLFLALQDAAVIGLLPHCLRTDVEFVDVAVRVQELEMH